MNRRNFFKAAAAIPLIALVPAAFAADAKPMIRSRL
jgi:hypothetical protein